MDLRGLTAGEVVVTRKPHACGGKEWRVVRTGADVKLECLSCGRVVMLSLGKAAAAVSERKGGGEK